MKQWIICATLSWCCISDAGAQEKAAMPYRNFPIILTLQFHSLSLPFRDLKSNFANPGLGIGTELSFNGKQNWVQQFNIVWYRNRHVGNGLLFFTQTVWRPALSGDAYAELKAGVGYSVSFRPVESYRQVNGKWLSAGHRGKGMLMLPAGASLGFNTYKEDLYYSSFVGYTVYLLKNYNESIPIVPETLIQAGTGIHLKY